MQTTETSAQVAHQSAARTHEIIRETAMLSDGLTRALKRDATAIHHDDQTRAEKSAISCLIPQVAEFLGHLLAAHDPKAGKVPAWHPVITACDIDEVAAAAIRAGFSAAMRDRPLISALREAGRLLEVINAHRMATETAPAKRQRRLRMAIKSAGTQQKRRKVILQAGEAEPWSEHEQVRMGEALICAASSTGLFEIVTRKLTGGRTQLYYVLSDEGRALCLATDEAAKLAPPILRPMLVPPRPWETPTTGAYLTDALARTVKLVRTRCPEQQALIGKMAAKGKLDRIMKSTTAMGNVPLRIRKSILELRTWAFESGIELEGTLPQRTPLLRPISTLVSTNDPSQTRKLRTQDAHVRRVNEGIAPNLLSWHATSREAEELAHEPEFYLPHNLDFRGRVYPVSAFSHHSTDATKALFEFANGKPLGTSGLYWLAVHLANCGDFGKISKRPYDERVQWVADNAEMIRRVALDPYTNLEWLEADAPFSFVAACGEYEAAMNQGEAFISHLPVALDGSNSGVQHYSAAQRAEEGRLVNLTPEPEPQDLYAAVGAAVARDCARYAGWYVRVSGKALVADEWLDRLNGLLDEIHNIRAADTGEDKELTKLIKARVAPLKRRAEVCAAVLWHIEGIGRSTVKRNVMTYCYSSEAFGMSQQLRADFMDPLALKVLAGKLPRHPFGDDDGRVAAGFLGKRVYRACVQVLPRVAAAMKWLQQASQVLAHEGHGVLMVTPLGFPMLQKITEWETKRVKIHVLDREVAVKGSLKRVDLNLTTAPKRTVLKDKQASAIAPNVIHACDATHLHMTVLGLLDAGVSDFLLIHDSFATHAGAVPVLAKTLRDAFVALYASWNPLTDVRGVAVKRLSDEGRGKLQPVPEQGALDLEKIRLSEYCFS